MNIKNVGIVGTVISGILLIFGIYKYNYSMNMYKASGYLTRIWKDRTDNYKLMVIICSVILLISIILFLSSLLKDKDISVSQETSLVSHKLKELEQIYKDNLITEEEYNTKRQELLRKM